MTTETKKKKAWGVRLKVDKEEDRYDAAFYDAEGVAIRPAALQRWRNWFLSRFPDVKSLLDVGCGRGDIAAVLQDDIYVAGCDFSVGSNVDQRLKNFSLVDLSKPANFDRKFDAVMSLEVYEHLDKEFEPQYLKNLASVDPTWLIVSCAKLGQIGRHHVNCQMMYEWVPKINELGYVVDVEKSREFFFLGKKEGQTLPNWYRNNTVVFERRR